MPTDEIAGRDMLNPDINCEDCLDEKNDKGVELMPEYDCGCKGYFPVSYKSVHFSNEKYRDILISISLLCKELDIMSFVNSLDDMSILLKTFNPKLNAFFE